MANNTTTKKPLFGNTRSKALNSTRKKQSLNMQNVILPDGTKTRMTVREAKKFRKNEVKAN